MVEGSLLAGVSDRCGARPLPSRNDHLAPVNLPPRHYGSRLTCLDPGPREVVTRNLWVVYGRFCKVLGERVMVCG
jgi:hypothetical protein